MTDKIHKNLNNSSGYKNDTSYVQKVLKRYSALSAALGGDKNFGKLAAAIIQKPLDAPPVRVWDSIKGYEGLLGVLLSFLPISGEGYKSVLLESKLNDMSDVLQDELCRTNGRTDPAVIIGNQMREKQIGKGLSIAEIGGSVSCRVMEALGATCACADAGYRGSSRPLVLWQKAGDFFSNPDDVITLDHYLHKFKGQFDLTVSNRLLDPGSGAEAIADGAGQASVSAGAMELLAVFSNITKLKGYSIHGGLTAQIPPEIFDYLGLDFVMKNGTHRESLTIFEKRAPNPDRFPDGVKMGHKTIFYNGQRDCFSLLPKSP